MPIFVVVRRLLNSTEVKDFIKLDEHLMNVLCMEPTVFHGFDNIATAGVVAPFLIHTDILYLHSQTVPEGELRFF